MAVDDSYTKLLLHMDGDDNGTTFTDEAGKTVTRYGNTCTKTAIKKFGTASGYFDGSGDYLNCGDSADLRFGAGDFTIDFWIYPSTVANNTAVFGKHTYGAFDEYQCYFITGGFLKFEATTNGSSWNVALTSGAAFSINTWSHIAIVRHGNVWAMFKDGVIVAGATVTGTIPTAYNSLLIGRVGSVYLTGYIDEFRVSKGIARWDSKFTPPASEAVYDATYDKLLLLMNGVDNGTTFTDEAGKAVTVAGNTCTKTAVKKFGTASVYFDGTGDYLQLADSADFEFGADEFCVDFWMNPSSVSINRGIFGKHTSGYYDEYYCYFSSTGIIRFYASTNGSSWDINLTANLAITTGNWYHIAVLRSKNVFVLCIDGQPVAVTVSSGTIGTSASSFWVGRITTYYNNGYMDDFRVAKGDSRWAFGFDVPTKPYGSSAPPPVSGGILFATFI